VNPALVSIAVTPAAQSLPVNGTLQFTATGTYSDNSQSDITGSVTRSSSPGRVATINSAGLATGVAAGDTTITATSGSKAGSTTLTITPILVSITVTADDPIIDINTTTQFTATGVLSDGSAQDLSDTVIWGRLCQEDEKSSCCTKDEGGPFGAVL
jgi:Bacterial Ig-like domain (group 2)